MKYTDDSALPEVTDEMLNEALPSTVPYTIVVLKAGPKFSPPGPDRDPWVAKLISQHGKRNFALRAEDVERIMSQDPGVKEGIFTYEIHPTRTFLGSTLPAPT